MIKIQKGIPVAPNRRGRKPLYPFSDMRVGDSFEVTTDDRTSVGNSARQWCEREGNGWKFTTSANGKKVRIWRIK